VAGCDSGVAPVLAIYIFGRKAIFFQENNNDFAVLKDPIKIVRNVVAKSRHRTRNCKVKILVKARSSK
jgi:hypothetical protein